MAVLTEVRPLEHQSGPWMRTFLASCRISSGTRGARRSKNLACVGTSTRPFFGRWPENRTCSMTSQPGILPYYLPHLSYLSFVMLPGRLDGPPNGGCHHLVSAFLSRIVSMNNLQPSLLAPPLQYIFVSPLIHILAHSPSINRMLATLVAYSVGHIPTLIPLAPQLFLHTFWSAVV